METTIVIQFRASDMQDVVTLKEWDWLHERTDELDKLLMEYDLGDCDGGQIGGGSMEIFCYVADTPRGVEVIKQYLTDHEWIGFCKIVSRAENAEKWEVHCPEGASFSIWKWV